MALTYSHAPGWTPADSIAISSSSFREPDGSNNNIHNKTLGAANTPYARSTKPLVFQNPNPPDPSTIFDTLMVRDPAKFRPHPNKISSMLFYLATIITHDIFQTVCGHPVFFFFFFFLLRRIDAGTLC